EGTAHRPHLHRGHGQDRRAGGGCMSPEISERSFEEAIECGLLQYGPDACAGDASAVRETSPPYGESPPGYRKRRPEDYDRALCLYGSPMFTAELKNPLSGQHVENAIHQHKTARDPREPLLTYGRCLAHSAADPDLVYVTTRLAGPKTRFLPFNQGKFGGA